MDDTAQDTTGPVLTSLHKFSEQARNNEAHLRVLETTDLHVHIFPYDYYADQPVNAFGLARTASLIETARSEARNSVLYDNGDFLQGNPMGDYIAYERGMSNSLEHPMITAMNTIGFDAGTLGNHEFNYGMEFLLNTVAGANFPIVCSNAIVDKQENPLDDATLLPPYVLIDQEIIDGTGATQTLKIGLIGFLPPQIMMWDRKILEGKVVARDIIETARAYVPEMKAKGADLIIALNHSGIGPTEHTTGMENAAVPLAGIDGIDVVLTGHTHGVFPSPDFEGRDGIDAENGLIHGKPATMAGHWGSHLGVIDLLLEKDGESWRVQEASVEARPISQTNPDHSITPLVKSVTNVLDSVRDVHEETLAYVRRPVGKTSAPLHSYFALVADDPSVQIVANAQILYVQEMMQGTEHEGLPILSSAAPFKSGGLGGRLHYTDVPAGDIAIKNVADLYLYPNTIRALRINGAQLKGWLERSAGLFNQIPSGATDALLLNPIFPSYDFDVVDGVTYRIDVTQPSRFGRYGELLDPSATRIIDLCHDGIPVTDDMEFIIATNNYRAGGGGQFPGADGTTVVFEGPDTNRDILVRYIIEQGTINPTADNNWSLAPIGDTTVLFQTGPGAKKHISQLEGLTLEEAGETSDGFTLYRLHL
nr:bifunctional 2',3'-cyclic-nucleotide 2'-phosphodiesterase/3'-nucleotidase [Celeribacter litoreus]